MKVNGIIIMTNLLFLKNQYYFLKKTLVNILIINIVTFLSSIIMVSAYNKGKDITSEIVMFLLSMLIVSLIFFSLGSFLSAFMKKPKASGSIATSILIGGFAISKVTDLTEHLDALNVLSPFKYFSYEDIVNGKSLSLGIVILSLLLAASFTIFTYYFYRKRDLNI